MKKVTLLILVLIPLWAFGIDRVEIWDFYEIELKGPETGNPFKDVKLSATFTSDTSIITVNGFYDGNGTYKIRFMPDCTGVWRYETLSNIKHLGGKSGKFECVAATGNNHGKVEVEKQYHFKYSDGNPYYPFGTTCYAWTSQSDSLQEVTLQTLSSAPFNKVRMCVFPKNMEFLWFEEPDRYAYEGTAPKEWDFSRLNPEFFQHLEGRILELRNLGIECDLIIFHPYDKGRWGFDLMSDEEDDLYLRYLMARFGSFRNIWWSLANEFDLMEGKQMEDWDRFFTILRDEDPYQHLRSIHHCKQMYDHTLPWVTHASIQASTTNTRKWIGDYKKPVVVDECKYEGNISFTWGDLTPEMMTLQFWDAVTKGGYASHGETYLHPENILWWASGGILHGESVERIAFLKKIIEEAPGNGLKSFNGSPIKWNRLNSVHLGDEYFLFYFKDRQPAERDIELPEHKKYQIEIIDTWNMTITRVEGLYSGITRVKLPSKPYIALRVIAQ